MTKIVRRTAVAVAVLAMLLAVAMPPSAGMRGTRLVGTVTSVDEDSRRVEIRDAEGVVHRLSWDSRTAVLSRPRPGMRMRLYVEPAANGGLRIVRIGKADKLSRR